MNFIQAGVCALFMVALFCVLASTIAKDKSNTWDESAHILAGYAYITEGMDYLSPLNHPVTGRSVSAALPALLYDLDFDNTVKPEGAPDSNFFQYSLKFLFENSVPGTRILFSARAGNIAVGVLLLFFVFLWSYRLWGAQGALLSVFFTALSPNILAHSSLATTDLPITAFFFISTYFLYLLSTEKGGLVTALLAALFISLALTTKHSALFLAPVLILSFIIKYKNNGMKKSASLFALLLISTYLLIWAFYGFRFHSGGAGYTGLNWARFGSSPLTPVYDFIRSYKLLPESYLFGIAGVLSGASSGRAAFLMGEYSGNGWWRYFTIAFLIKTPIPTILFFITSVLYLLREKFLRLGDSRRASKALWLFLPALMFFILLSSQNVNIGLRHILPIYPFIFVLIGSVPSLKIDSKRVAKRILVVGLVWYAVSAASIFPNQLAYFNEFIGGPDNGYKYLVDSNLDWGQDLPALKDFMEENSIDKIKLSYFGFSDPRYYGIDYEYLPSYYMPRTGKTDKDIELKGWFAISATMLQGVYLQRRNLYQFFKTQKPVAVLGHSIFIYRF